jgi:prophage endopeptidase
VIALSMVWGFLKRIPWQAWAVLAILAGLAYFSHTRYQAGYDEAMAEVAELKAEQEIAFEKMARNQERKHAIELYDISTKFILERAKGYEQRDQTIADLRAGTLRLRDKFRCKASLPGSSAAASGSDAASTGGLSDQDAEFLVREASRADAVVGQLTACQAVVKSDREMENP